MKPCQTARLYSGVAAPSTDDTAACRKGPMVRPGMMPTTRHAITRNMTGNRIQNGGSCGSRGKLSGGAPRKIEWMSRME